MTAQREATPAGLLIIATVLRQLRAGVHLTQDQLAKKINYARSLVSNAEQAREMPSKEFLAACDEFFNTGTMLVEIRAEAMSDGLPDWALEMQDAEARAVSIASYQPSVVPGLLQTAEYAGAMLNAGMFGEPDDDALAARVSNRMQRQKILDKQPRPEYWVILTEAVLARIVGDERVMADQLTHIIKAMEGRKVNLQVLPCAAGAASMPAPATLLEMPDGSVLMHADGPVAGSTTANSATIRECRKRFDALRAQAASLAESARIIRARMEDLQL